MRCISVVIHKVFLPVRYKVCFREYYYIIKVGRAELVKEGVEAFVYIYLESA